MVLFIKPNINPTPTSPPDGDENEIRVSCVADLLGSDHVVPTSTSGFDVFAASPPPTTPALQREKKRAIGAIGAIGAKRKS